MHVPHCRSRFWHRLICVVPKVVKISGISQIGYNHVLTTNFKHLPSLRAFGINPDLEQSAQSSIHKGSMTCETRTAAAEQPRQARKAGASDPLPNVPVSPREPFGHRMALSATCTPTDRFSPHDPWMAEVVLVTLTDEQHTLCIRLADDKKFRMRTIRTTII